MCISHIGVFVLILSLECSLVCFGLQVEDWNESVDADLVVQPDSWPDDPPDQQTVTALQFVGKPTGLKVTPVPLAGSDHELSFNVTWDLPIGQKVQAYSLEVHSATNTIDCRLVNFCYETNIPGDAVWSLIPAYFSPDADGCAVRPGCAYWIKLIASPWDGHSYADLHVELDECVEGVCSCAHAPRLPAPVVSAKTIAIHGDLFVNVSWSLPVPTEPLRLPPRLRKQYYLISIGKEIGRAWHPHIVTRRFDAFGFVVIPETFKWRLLPVNERSGARSGVRSGARVSDGPTRSIVLDVKLIARVSLVDERGCTGPAGNATAYDPSEPKTPIPVSGFQFQALWAVFGGACVLAMVVILAFSARAVKRVMKEFRPEPAPATLQPLRPRPNWFPQDAHSLLKRYDLDGSAEVISPLLIDSRDVSSTSLFKYGSFLLFFSWICFCKTLRERV